MLGLDDVVAAHVRAAEKLARSAGLDLVGVAHVVAAMCQRPSWLRERLGEDADSIAESMLARLGSGDGGIPAWSPRLRDVLERAAGAANAVVDEPHLVAAIAHDADGVVAEVLFRAGPVPAVAPPATHGLGPEKPSSNGNGNGNGRNGGNGHGSHDDDDDDDDDDDELDVRYVAPPKPKPTIEVEVASVRIGPPTPTLDRFGRDLVALANKGVLKPAFGRADVFERIAITLARHTKPHVILVGEAGVGKTAIAEGLAVKIAGGELPDLAKTRIVALEPAALVAGATYRGELEQRVRDVLAEAAASRTLVFIDEIHGLLATGGGLSAADVLKPALAKGDVRVIGATTEVEYGKTIARDAALARRFERIDVAEPDAAETLAIVRGVAAALEQHHGVAIDPAAIESAVDLTSRYLPARRQPDKSIDIIDEACARARREGRTRIETGDIARATTVRAGVVLSELGTQDRADLAGLDARIAARVIGQTTAVDALCRLVVRGRLGLKPAGKPVGVVLLWGPSGVGKTALAHAIAEEAFGAASLLRIDLAEFSESHQVARLIGAPPGYIGHDGDGLLTAWLRAKPHSVVLLDEIDKAHARVREVLLGLFDAGRIADGRGVQISGEHALFVATGVAGFREPRALLGPELVGRLDALITMQRLGFAEYRRIAHLLVDDARGRLARARVTLDVDDSVLDLLARAGGRDALGQDLGARPIRGAVERTLVDPIATIMLTRSPPITIRAIAHNGTIKLSG